MEKPEKQEAPSSNRLHELDNTRLYLLYAVLSGVIFLFFLIVVYVAWNIGLIPK